VRDSVKSDAICEVATDRNVSDCVNCCARVSHLMPFDSNLYCRPYWNMWFVAVEYRNCKPCGICFDPKTNFQIQILSLFRSKNKSSFQTVSLFRSKNKSSFQTVTLFRPKLNLYFKQ
jgi:hypothetical protein